MIGEEGVVGKDSTPPIEPCWSIYRWKLLNILNINTDHEGAWILS